MKRVRKRHISSQKENVKTAPIIDTQKKLKELRESQAERLEIINQLNQDQLKE